MKRIKLVVSDIDGTLIEHGEEFPQAVARVVEELSAWGIGFTFASGRLPYMITPFVQKLGIDLPVCACNGTLIYRGEEILESHPLRARVLRPLITAALLRGMTVLYAVRGVEYCFEENEATRRKRAERGTYHPIRPIGEREWDTLLVDKMNIIDEGRGVPALKALEEELADRCHITHYGESGLEIVAAGYGKEYGIRRLAGYLGISVDEILAIGDNENDDAMIRLAGVGGAVGNAIPQTKACADIVAERAGGEGVAEIIQKVCLEGNGLAGMTWKE